MHSLWHVLSCVLGRESESTNNIRVSYSSIVTNMKKAKEKGSLCQKNQQRQKKGTLRCALRFTNNSLRMKYIRTDTLQFCHAAL